MSCSLGIDGNQGGWLDLQLDLSRRMSSAARLLIYGHTSDSTPVRRRSERCAPVEGSKPWQTATDRRDWSHSVGLWVLGGSFATFEFVPLLDSTACFKIALSR